MVRRFDISEAALESVNESAAAVQVAAVSAHDAVSARYGIWYTNIEDCARWNKV
jgi:hypothetical protein